jgi:hypothetical protein
MNWLTAVVAGKEKILIGVLALIQTYASQVDWLSEPEKGLVIGTLGLAQVWLGADSRPAHPDQ